MKDVCTPRSVKSGNLGATNSFCESTNSHEGLRRDSKLVLMIDVMRLEKNGLGLMTPKIISVSASPCFKMCSVSLFLCLHTSQWYTLETCFLSYKSIMQHQLYYSFASFVCFFSMKLLSVLSQHIVKGKHAVLSVSRSCCIPHVVRTDVHLDTFTG